MNLDTILSSTTSLSCKDVVEQCETFLQWTAGVWVYKTLPDGYPPIKRVRVRHRSVNTVEAHSFNCVLSHYAHNLWGRHVNATFAQPTASENGKAYALLFPETFQMVRADISSIVDALRVSSTQSTDMASLIREAISDHCIPVTPADINTGALGPVIVYSVSHYYAVHIDLLPQLQKYVKQNSL